jgi:hypothetical protein
VKLTFAQAVNHVVQTKQNAFAFVPELRRGKQIGGKIYVLEYDDDSDGDPQQAYLLHFSNAPFGSTEAEAEVYLPDDVPEEARSLRFQPTTTAAGVMDLQTQLALTELAKGIPKT